MITSNEVIFNDQFQLISMAKFSRKILFPILLIIAGYSVSAQVNSVTFGKNRFSIKIQMAVLPNEEFQCFLLPGWTGTCKFIAQSAEKELPEPEASAEYSLQRRANIIVYNQFADMQQTNIGL